MKYVDAFRDPVLAKAALSSIAHLCADLGVTEDKPLHIMEICGGHTHAIFRYGLDRLVPKGLEFVHGPGCPVCVLPMSRVDDCLEIAEREGVIFTTFGDAMRVPGTRKSLLQAKAEGADIRMVYSPMDALLLARQNPTKDVVFFGLGFETTMPPTALTLIRAKADNVSNFSLFCNHVLVPPPLKALLDDPLMKIDGFVGPGHVSMIIGTKPYDFIARDYHKPLVVAGFEPLDLLQAVVMVLEQIKDGRCEIENQYGRVVPEDGNGAALKAIDEVYEMRDKFDWRGLGEIDHSGVKIRKTYAAFDAEEKFHVGYAAGKTSGREPEGCRCGDVVKGMIKPTACEKYAKECTPERPLGALMVSTEGACSAYYLYSGVRAETEAV
jgi:hydrogenase expression/formation protein HypD